MSYPNSALSAGQLIMIAVVVVACMAAWLSAVFMAARNPRQRDSAVTQLPQTTEEAEHKSAA